MMKPAASRPCKINAPKARGDAKTSKPGMADQEAIRLPQGVEHCEPDGDKFRGQRPHASK